MVLGIAKVTVLILGYAGWLLCLWYYDPLSHRLAIARFLSLLLLFRILNFNHVILLFNNGTLVYPYPLPSIRSYKTISSYQLFSPFIFLSDLFFSDSSDIHFFFLFIFHSSFSSFHQPPLSLFTFFITCYISFPFIIFPLFYFSFTTIFISSYP